MPKLTVEGVTTIEVPMGKRLVREWLCRPLGELGKITARHACVATLVSDRRMAAGLAEEGRAQAEAFAARSAMVPEAGAISFGRAAGDGRLLTPGHDGTDGFFVARWQAPC